ncbi:MAG: hypothetical protein QM640_12095 [Niabella sp.]
MKVTFLNRNIVLSHCKSNDELVKWMMKNDYDLNHKQSLATFMESYADRKKLFENISLSHNSIDSFVDDLIANRIISVEK